jgi:GT2 family glycosyltransferase
MSVDLSIIIVNWNTRELLAQCLESVRSDADTLKGWNVETLVVDNASADGSAEMVREQFPWANLIENRANVGFARANNQAIARAAGQYLLLLNSDAEIQDGALGSLLEFVASHPGAGAVGARLLNPDGSLQLSCHPMLTPGREMWRLLFLDRVYPRASYPMHRWDTSTPRRVEVIKGACFLARRAALDQVGLLDESYFMYTEEVDLCYRLAQAGWEVWWAPGAEVVHQGEASSRQVAEAMYVQLYRSKIQFYRKFGGEGRARQAKLLLTLAYAPRAVITGLASTARPALRSRAGLYRRFLAELPAM